MASETFNLDIQINSQPAEAALKRLQTQFNALQNRSKDLGKNASNSLKDYTSSIKTATGVTELFGKAIALIGIGKLASETIQIVSEIETLNSSLETVTGSAKGAADALILIRGVSEQSVFKIQDLGNAFINLQANGVTPTTELLKTFADAASVSTDKLGALNALANLFARNAQGGLNLQDLNTLANAGIPVFKILADKIGIARGQIADLGRNAEGANIILRALQSGINSQFGGAAEGQLSTLNGQFTTLKKNFQDVALSFGEGGFTTALKDILKSINDVTPALKSLASSLGGQVGDSLKGIGTALTAVGKAVKFVSDNFILLASIVAGIGLAAFLPEIAAVIAGLRGLYIGVLAVIENFGALTAGLTITRGAWIVFTEVIEAFLAVFRPLVVALKSNVVISFITKTSSAILAAIPAWVKWGLAILGVGKAVDSLTSDKSQDKGTLARLGITPNNTAGAGRGNGQAELAARTAQNAEQEAADRKRAQDLALTQSATIRKIIDALKEESKQIGVNKIEAEARNKISEAEAAIKEKLIAAGKQQEAQAFRLNSAEAGAIRNAVAQKYSLIIKESIKDQEFELSLVGKTALEAEKLRAIREIELEYGKKGLGIDKERSEALANIVRLQDAQVNNRIQDSFAGIRNEIDLLKLSNAEREKAIELDRIAQDAGFRNRAEFIHNRPKDAQTAENLIDKRNKATVEAAGREQIQTLKEQLDLLKKVDDKERERATTLQEIYKQIDPNGRGKNISDAQKEQIRSLEAQIEAQNAFLEVSKKIQDQFETLGSAVTKAFLGGKDAVQQLKLELIKLAALEAFRYFAGGISSGASGSFFSGLIQGLGGSRAGGGPVQAGVPYRINEKGPETVVFPQNGTVIPNQDAQMRISSKTGNITVQVNPVFQNHGTINSTEDLEGYMAQWGEGLARQTEKFVREQFSPTGLAYNR